MNATNKFVHLHVHTEYSLLDGSIKIKDLMKRTKELGMDTIAITDHGSMFGVVQFYKQAKTYGIKPILGSEVYVAINKYTEREPKDKSQYHLVLLAENNEGYENLMKIVSEGYVNGFYYKPRIDHDILRKYNKGIIALSACLGGEIQQHLLDNNYDRAKKVANDYKKIFGENNFFLELQNHGVEEQLKVNKQLVQISEDLDIPLVATNDVHYLDKSDAAVHDILLCIQTGKTVQDTDRMKFPTNQFYLKSPEEMESIFGNYKNAIENTVWIGDRCNVDLDFDTLHLPEYEVPEGYTNESYLRELSLNGLKSRYNELTDEIMNRFEYEFKTIVDMGYIDYFLIVWDFIKFAKDNRIMVGPGRGSAAGSIISYGLGIIDIDPLKYGLIFERFLNPERVTMPDIDIDFCYERREEVIEYVVKKYGADRVSQIVTFGTMAARGAIRDVGRAINMPYGDVDYIAKQIPTELGMTINKALEVNNTLKKEYDNNPDTKRLIDFAMAVEGLPRHTSTHAAGVVISKEPITNYVPLLRNGDIISTQFNMIELEELGLLKMDFLGLRTLTVIRDAVNLIEENHGIKIDFDNFNYDDPKVLEMFAKAETLGIFQFESPGMRAFLKELKPNVFENLIAANSLFRPGPMNQIPTFVECKHDPSKITYIHPKLEHILDVTYGCIVYQEQVMQIVRDIGGYSMGRADLVRRAMGKKKMDVMEEERQNFIYGQVDEKGDTIIPGAIKNGVDEKSANKIYDLMIDFANYAFNKSHSAAYAVIAYRTGWLKYYYPVEFMAAQISSIMGDTNSVSLYIQECKRLGIEILPPDINKSYGKFTVLDGKIRFGLTAVKNVGINLIRAIVKGREIGEFTSFTDFVEKVEKVDSSAINKRAIESLIKCGAMDSLGANRAQLLAIFEKIIDGVHADRKRNIEGQFSIFDTIDNKDNEDNLPSLKEFPQKILLSMEKDILGIYVSGHPLEPYKKELAMVSNITTPEIFGNLDEGSNNIIQAKDGQRIKIGGIIVEKKNKITRNNNMMAFISLEDMYGVIECIVFPKTYENYNNILNEDELIVVEGRLSVSEIEEPKIICARIYPLNNYKLSRIYIKFANKDFNKSFGKVKSILEKHKGNTPVYMYLESQNKTFMADKSLWVNIEDQALIKKLENLLGKDSVKTL
ncbi:DNA polymerase III subunit alpha [Wansuia hejianensis]|uniref:DNA polymerase III subunit alpha n=1 Tax=Wansuia hejianensis TaxID=2763667 RepID=A0A926EVI4_9FIRM|nr:DNA polymerase III subunit alpha [Wansuia hejianensis]MBC8589691.1 DNA polymerase III subunit alpha [Wansuia hejianensis]